MIRLADATDLQRSFHERQKAITARIEAAARRLAQPEQPRVVPLRRPDSAPVTVTAQPVVATPVAGHPVASTPCNNDLPPVRRRPVMFAELPPHPAKDGPYRYRAFLRIAAEAGHVSPEDILGDCRAGQIVRPRQMFFWLAKRFTQMSLTEIGRRAGYKDHTTVLHGIRRVEAAIAVHGALASNEPRAWAEFLLARPWPTGPVKPSLIRQREAA